MVGLEPAFLPVQTQLCHELAVANVGSETLLRRHPPQFIAKALPSLVCQS
jgi:hypothetical protein